LYRQNNWKTGCLATDSGQPDLTFYNVNNCYECNVKSG